MTAYCCESLTVNDPSPLSSTGSSMRTCGTLRRALWMAARRRSGSVSGVDAQTGLPLRRLGREALIRSPQPPRTITR